VRKIASDDLRREFRVSEWWAWTHELLADLRGSNEGREYMRFQKGPIKRLKEEVVPTLRFAERHFPDRDLLASFPASDQPGSPDALIRAACSRIRVPLQVTCDWTYEDEQRLRKAHRDGYSVGRMYSLEGIIIEISTIIADRLAAKTAHGGYDPSTWLLVHINDERWPPEALPGILAAAKAAAASSPFAATFLVGSSDEKRICVLLNGKPVIPASWRMLWWAKTAMAAFAKSWRRE
jgi:hypothetical protein